MVRHAQEMLKGYVVRVDGESHCCWQISMVIIELFCRSVIRGSMSTLAMHVHRAQAIPAPAPAQLRLAVQQTAKVDQVK